MRIAVLGTGGAALGYAALLVTKGHEVVMFSLSGQGGHGLRASKITASGAIETSFSVDVQLSLQDAVHGAAGIIVASPANAHRLLMDGLSPLLASGQHVLVSAELSMSGAYLARKIGSEVAGVSITSLATTLMLGRRTGTSSVMVGGIREANDAWAWPPERMSEALDFWRFLFGDCLSPVASHYAIALSNLNPPAHMANALCNFTRIEKGEAWANYDGITESVARLIEALDVERLTVAEAFGLSVRSVERHYQLSFGLERGSNLAQMAAEVHQRRQGPPGPTSVDTRFVTEDIPFGIAFVEHLGRSKCVPTPLHSAGLYIFSAMYGRNFRFENDLI